MSHDEALTYCRTLIETILAELDAIPAEVATAIETCHPTNPLWAYKLRELASELYMVLPKPERSHMQQAYAARLEEHQQYISSVTLRSSTGDDSPERRDTSGPA